MQKITKDGAQYQVYQLGFLQGINKGVFDIYKHLLGSKKSPDQVKADKAREEAGYGSQREQDSGIRDIVAQTGVANDLMKQSDKRIAEQNAIIDEQLKKGKKANKVLIEEAKRQIAIEEELKKQQQENLVKLDGQLKILTDSNDANQKASEALKMLLMQNKAGAGQQIASMLEEGMGIDEIASKLGISLTDATEALMSAGRTDLADKALTHRKGYYDYQVADEKKKVMADAAARVKAAPATTPTPATPVHAEAGLIGSYQVKKQSENLLLHRGESVTGAQQGGGKSINITVNATETDLAKKIANEIQAAIYQAKMA